MKQSSAVRYETVAAWILAAAFVGLIAIPKSIPSDGVSRPALIVDIGTPGATPSADDAAIRRFPADAD